MKRILLMCEGNDEKAFLEVLLKKKILIFDRDELVYHEIFHARQFREDLLGRIAALPRNDTIAVYRVGDKLSDRLVIPPSLKQRIVSVTDISTTPEFEILMIIREGLFQKFSKKKSSLKPSAFYRTVHPDYHKQSEYVFQYFDGMGKEEIYALVKEYVERRGKTTPKGKKTLALLLR